MEQQQNPGPEIPPLNPEQVDPVQSVATPVEDPAARMGRAYTRMALLKEGYNVDEIERLISAGEEALQRRITESNATTLPDRLLSGAKRVINKVFPQ